MHSMWVKLNVCVVVFLHLYVFRVNAFLIAQVSILCSINAKKMFFFDLYLMFSSKSSSSHSC